MNFYHLILVGSGGFLGSVARFAASKSIDEKLNSVFPFGTLTVNIAGSFILGLIYGWLSQKTGDTQNIKLFLATGFCGGFTTYSAFAVENVNLINEKLIPTSILYIIISLSIGILAVFAGLALGKNI